MLAIVHVYYPSNIFCNTMTPFWKLGYSPVLAGRYSGMRHVICLNQPQQKYLIDYKGELQNSNIIPRWLVWLCQMVTIHYQDKFALNFLKPWVFLCCFGNLFDTIHNLHFQRGAWWWNLHVWCYHSLGL